MFKLATSQKLSSEISTRISRFWSNNSAAGHYSFGHGLPMEWRRHFDMKAPNLSASYRKIGRTKRGGSKPKLIRMGDISRMERWSIAEEYKVFKEMGHTIEKPIPDPELTYTAIKQRFLRVVKKIAPKYGWESKFEEDLDDPYNESEIWDLEMEFTRNKDGTLTQTTAEVLDALENEFGIEFTREEEYIFLGDKKTLRDLCSYICHELRAEDMAIKGWEYFFRSRGQKCPWD